MNVISASHGNDSIASIQWAHEANLQDVTVVYLDTGWSSPEWPQRVIAGERLAKSYGFKAVQLSSKLARPERTEIGEDGLPRTLPADKEDMRALVRIKKGWPRHGMQFCTIQLKGLPFLKWIDEADPECKAVVLIGQRRAESTGRKHTPEFIESSEYHGGRKVWHPLYAHTDEQRNELLARAGFEVLPYRSRECYPCVNANKANLAALSPGAVQRVSDLEVELGQPMFRAGKVNALGIYGAIAWAKDGRERGDIDEEESECASLFGCGT